MKKNSNKGFVKSAEFVRYHETTLMANLIDRQVTRPINHIIQITDNV